MTSVPPDPATNAVLDSIIEARRSVRAFTTESPPRELIGHVLRAGLFAPFAGAAMAGLEDFRRFVVIGRGTRECARLEELARAHALSMAADLTGAPGKDPGLRLSIASFRKRLESFGASGVPGIGTAPYLIIVAERRGFPPVELQSSAHCLENMWLKATALGLGFHLVTIVSGMGENREVCTLLDLPFGEFSLNGCAIGYPSRHLPKALRPDVETVTRWIL